MRRGKGTGFDLGELGNLRSSSYVAGSINNFRRVTGLQSMGSNADWHYRNQSEFLRMIELARSFDRNDPIINPALNRLCDNVLQGGFTPDPQTGNDDADAELKALWREWADNPAKCHRAKRYNFHGIERLTLRSIIVDGDILHLPLQTGHLQEIEAHRIRTPNRNKQNLVHGIKLDEMTGAAVEYWITQADVGIDSILKNDDMKRIPAWDGDNPAAFHVYFPKRFSQSRGITSLAPVVDYVGMNDDANFATMVARKVQSCFSILETLPPDTSIEDAGAMGSESSLTISDGTVTTVDDIYPGMRHITPNGGQLQGFSPNNPSMEFMKHSEFVLSVIAANHDIPLQMLLLDPSKTNFSGWRGAMDEARKAFRRIQRELIDRFHSRVWRWKVRQWLQDSEVLQRAVGEGLDVYAHRWNPPTWRYIEPNKDVSADKMMLESRLNSPRRVFNERGMDWNEVAPEIVADNALIIKLALEAANEINTKYPEAELDFREIIHLNTAPVNVSTETETMDEEERNGAASRN